MKKIIALLLTVAAITAIFCGCKSQEDNKKDEGKLKVVTTIFPPYDFARQLGGDKVTVSMLLKPGMESHNFDPTPQDIINVQNADLFIYTGGESDKWVKDILESDDKKPKKVLAMMDCVDVVTEDTVEGMTKEEEENEGDEIEYDEHVWTSPENAMTISRKISEALKELSPSDIQTFEKNTKDYTKELSVLDNDFKKAVENGKRKIMVFADRFPFRYFADAYGLSYFAAFPGCSADTEPSAATISFLINKVKEEKIPVVFTIEFSNKKIADTICEGTGAKQLEFHSCHNVSQEMLDNGSTYVSIMKSNLEHLKEALA